MQVTIPIRLVSVANQREHWATKAKRAKAHRRAAWGAIIGGMNRARSSWRQFIDYSIFLDPITGCLVMPVVVTLVRVGKRQLDGDNLQSAFKSVRDGVADALGLLDDSDSRVTWVYDQDIGEYEVRIHICARSEVK